MIPLRFVLLFSCWLASSTLISHDYQMKKISSKNSNIVSLDLIDDSTFDIHYQTKCEECKCFVDLPALTNQLVAEKTFRSKAINSFMESDILYILHQSDSDNFYYSVYRVGSSELQEIMKESPISSFKGSQDIHFSSSLKGFFAYYPNAIITNSFNDANKLVDQQHRLNRNDESKIYDVAIVNNTLYLAKGELGIEVISINKDAQKIQHFSIQDLELKNGSVITKLGLNHAHTILYAFSEMTTNSSFFLALDIQNPNEVTIVNNYHQAIYNVVNVVQTFNEIHVISNIGERYYYTQFSLIKDDKFANIDLNKVWEIPFKVNSMRKNGDTLLIEGDDYLYIFKKNLVYETEAPELLLEVVKKTGSGDFHPSKQKQSTHFINVALKSLKHFSVNKNPVQPSFSCGSFAEKYQGEFVFYIFVYKNSCPELGKNNQNDICLYRYIYDITFAGKDFKPQDSSPYLPMYIDNSNWDNSIYSILNEETHKSTENKHKHSENKTSNHNHDQSKNSSATNPSSIYNNRFDIRMKYVFIIAGIILIGIFTCLLKSFCGNSKEEYEFDDDEHPDVQHHPLDETEKYDDSEVQNDQDEEDEKENEPEEIEA